MIHFIIGTRAQLIKMAPILVECRDRGLPYNFIYIAQHKETIFEMLDMFGLPAPDHVVGDIGRDITHPLLMLRWGANLFRECLRIGARDFRRGKRGVAVVHGDALPALIGGIWAKAAGIEVAHVEAGLRSFDFFHPFPEELIRVSLWRLRLVDLYFCPTPEAFANVAPYRGTKIDTRYNTLIDALRLAFECGESPAAAQGLVPEGKFGIVTIHRTETLFNRARLEFVLREVKAISRRLRIVFILHPSTRKALVSQGLMDDLAREPGLHLYPRLEYFTFIDLLRRSEFLITDGGSNQEECHYMGHPCLLFRNKTERPEGLGRNVVLSNLDPRIIGDFVNGYDRYRVEPVTPAERPSKIIVDCLEPYR